MIKTRYTQPQIIWEIHQRVNAIISTVFNLFVGLTMSLKSQMEHGASQSDLALSQLLQCYCSAQSEEETTDRRHAENLEQPLAVYADLLFHAKTRKRQQIDQLHDNGLSLPHSRVLEITSELGGAVVEIYPVYTCRRWNCISTSPHERLVHNTSNRQHRP